MKLRIGVLALQGDFEAHRRMLASLGAEATEVRTVPELDGLDGLVIPGGESTTISMGMEREGLDDAIRSYHRDGGPIFGSCAGMIVCDRGHLGLADYICRRNAFGRQLQSFEEDLRVAGLGDEPLRAVFIRAPWVEEHGPDVEVLAECAVTRSPSGTPTFSPSPSTRSSPTTAGCTPRSWRCAPRRGPGSPVIARLFA